jgi:hypothetical protein
MPSLFDLHDNREILSRLDRLTADTPPLWGKMTAAQMAAHSQCPLLVASGEMPLKRGLIGILFGRMSLKKYMEPGTFGKELPTHPRFRIKGSPDFDREKERLKQLIARFAEKGTDGLSKDPHPFFGPLTTEQWDVLQWKHLDHHLRQFGL